MNNTVKYLKGNIMTQSGFDKGVVGIADGKIVDVSFNNDGFYDNLTDVGDLLIVPGFIDLHMHGIHRNLVDHGMEALQQITQDLLIYGVTGFLPTVYPRPAGEDVAYIKSITNIQPKGALVLGFHLEGPFLKLTGSLSQTAISRFGDKQRAKSLIDACKPHKAIFSISPDIEGINDVIPMMAENNTPVFMTHTAANVSETLAAIKSGANHATHFYDVFPCPEVTEPGVRPCGIVETVLADKNVSVDFILDGVHVDPIAVKMALACKSSGLGVVCLITDSNIGAGLEPGTFTFGESGDIYFEYKGAPARSVEGKYLAGSGLTMDQAVRNAVTLLNLPLHEAITLASENPAKVLKINDRKGKVEQGYDADLIIIDNDVNVKQAWVSGELKYIRQ